MKRLTIDPRRAAVRPRVVSPDTGDPLLLEDVIQSQLAKGFRGAVELLGTPGAGKSTALAHLASLPLADQLVLLDDAWASDIQAPVEDRLVVYTTRETLKLTDARFDLAPWSSDDLIEYLLATHPDQCSSIISRFTADENGRELDGVPVLMCLVAEQMAGDPGIDIRTALRQVIAQHSGDDRLLHEARDYAWAKLVTEQIPGKQMARWFLPENVDTRLLGLLEHRFVRLLLAADHAIDELSASRRLPEFNRPLPPSLVREIARMVHNDSTRLAWLQQMFGRHQHSPMVASILHAADPGWRPKYGRSAYLPGAYLSGAQWRSIRLPGANLERADLRRSDLREAELRGARLESAKLRRVRAERARLAEVRAKRADFGHADLSGADLTEGDFQEASFRWAVLRDAVASGASFFRADLRHASFVNARLMDCDLRQSALDEVDLRGADLSRAKLPQQSLRTVLLQGANLEGADMWRCDLELVHWPHARLGGANLTGSYLTGSNLSDGDLRQARLGETGLADIQWERVDLRGANLQGCTFHMGSSRSGLVGSPYPCHGSRTGFYTDDYDEHLHRPPEEIRKANLCGADLRGARVDGVDFYLVDLRGAKYDRRQEAHFRRCDAILGSLG